MIKNDIKGRKTKPYQSFLFAWAVEELKKKGKIAVCPSLKRTPKAKISVAIELHENAV